jgi:hypothetical protein
MESSKGLWEVPPARFKSCRPGCSTARAFTKIHSAAWRLWQGAISNAVSSSQPYGVLSATGTLPVGPIAVICRITSPSLAHA